MAKSDFVLVRRDYLQFATNNWPNKRNMKTHEDGEVLGHFKHALASERPDANAWNHEREQVIEQMSSEKPPVQYEHREQLIRLRDHLNKYYSDEQVKP